MMNGIEQVMAQYLSGAADEAEDPQLAKLLRRGVAIHNSGLSPGDRGLVERAFLSGRYHLSALHRKQRILSTNWQ